jgi:1-deoxy-D-xylulose-5-phosphate synthase
MESFCFKIVEPNTTSPLKKLFCPLNGASDKFGTFAQNHYMTSIPGKLLAQINSPADLRKLGKEQLPQLADELRTFILDVVSANPGHLGASLGVVELTVALHYCFNTPDDKLIWDVGHQAYGHKILTGRRTQFESLRKLGGVSGFPVMAESEYDAFGTGHASTALSAALGMAQAARIRKTDRQHIAVVGDGAITGGMFFEALNQAGDSNVNLLIILNDNGIAIDHSSGALKDYLLRQAEKTNSTAFSNPLFEAFNISCNGPVDGNNLHELLPAIEAVSKQQGVRLLHVLTTKGKGFEKAERDQVRYHAPGTFDRQTGAIAQAGKLSEIPLYQEVFGQTLLELGAINPNIVAISPAMVSGSNLGPFMAQYPNRCFDVGIAEQHAVTFAAGLAAEGLIPYCTIYSTFLQRAYDQLIHDVALQQLPVVFCIDRAGLVGEDGATHHGAFDLAYLKAIPGINIAAPMNEVELRNLMFTAQLQTNKLPMAIRYPRGTATTPQWRQPFESVETGKGRLLREGNGVAIASLGHPGNFVAEALDKLQAQGISCSHADLRFLKPLDTTLVHRLFDNHHTIITVEDGVTGSGLGSELAMEAIRFGYKGKIINLGIPDAFIPHGKPHELHALCGFDTTGIEKTIRQNLG